MIEAERTLLFASNYPHWELGDPFAMLDELPQTLRRRILVENALALYGERLLRPNRSADTGQRYTNARAATSESAV